MNHKKRTIHALRVLPLLLASCVGRSTFTSQTVTNFQHEQQQSFFNSATHYDGSEFDPDPGHQRQLKELSCSPSMTMTGTYNDDDHQNLQIPQSRFAFLSFGTEGRKLIQMLRRKNDDYYQNVVDNIIMATCDISQKERDRCVPSTSEFAARDWNNECIVAAGYSCGEGMCEITSNCFWGKVENGEVRKSRFPKEEYDLARDRLYGMSRESYAGDITTLTIVGICVAATFFVLWMIYFIGRYCCCCLWTSCAVCKPCSPIPKEDGYNVILQWVLPCIIYLGGLIGIITSGCMAIIGNEDINVAATACFAYVSLLIDNLGRFLETSSIPLNELKDIVATAAEDALQIFNNTGYVRTTATEIIESFGDFMDLHVLGLNGNEGIVTGAKDTFNANVEPIVDQIQGMLDTLETDLYEGSDLINTTLSNVVTQIGSFRNDTDVWQKNITTYEQLEDSTRVIRQASILSLFILGATVCFAGFIGIMTSRKQTCTKLHSLMNIAGIISALLGSICLIVSSFTLLVSFLWHDACEISNLVVADFEPILGETIAQGANAIFDGTNLAVAFNVTDKIDFEEKLNEGLAEIESVNITKQFELVVDPLEEMQETVVDTVKDTAWGFLESSNISGGTIHYPGECHFDYQWRRSQWDDMYVPWKRSQKIGSTSWALNSTGSSSTLDRVGNEGPEEYIERIYSIAGRCRTDLGDCCLNNDCTLSQNAYCNSGSDCKRNDVCDQTSMAIREAYKKWHDANRMSANLGTECPPGSQCPTAEFRAEGHNETLIGLVTAYGENITDTADSLINIANTTVGDAMTQVRVFLCNMNIAFVADGYTTVRDEVCVTMLGGFTQINWGLWMLGIWLEIIAILANVLATRLRGYSRKEASVRMSEISFGSGVGGHSTYRSDRDGHGRSFISSGRDTFRSDGHDTYRSDHHSTYRSDRHSEV